MNPQPSITTYQTIKLETIIAKIISYVFHPLFIPTYFFLFLVKVFPFDFPDVGVWQLKLKVFTTFWMTAVFPALIILIAVKLELGVKSLQMKEPKERILPFFITMFFYWWMYYLSKNFGNQPYALKFFYFGIFISTSLGVVINNFIKISLHGMGVGGLVAALALTAFYYQTSLGLPIAIAILIAGMVCTSRFIAGTHTNAEMYIGVIVGAGCQLIGYWWV